MPASMSSLLWMKPVPWRVRRIARALVKPEMVQTR